MRGEKMFVMKATFDVEELHQFAVVLTGNGD